MLPIQFILLLILVTIPRELDQAARDAHGGGMPSLDFVPAPVALVSLILCHVCLVVLAFGKAKRAIRQVHEPTAATGDIALKAEGFLARARWFTCAITAVHLFATPLAKAALAWFQDTQVLKYLLLPELLFLMPAVLAWVAMWTAGYYVEAAVRERGMPYQLARGRPVHEMPALGAYLAMQMRHNFYPVVFLVLQGFITALGDGLGRYTSADAAQLIAFVIGVVPLLLMLPWLLTRMWSTVPLTGALRERLEGVAARYGLRFRDIRLWRTHNMVINAAIVGWFPRGRYFLMSDALVESFTDWQLEAVFAHEVGHGIHRHLHWMILSFASAVGLAAGATGLAVSVLPLNGVQGDMVTLVLSSALLIGLIGGAIALISPRFEHQADWFACRHMALMLREAAAPAPPVGTAGEALPAAWQGVLAAAPTAAERVTAAEYAAGAYPHSAGAGEEPRKGKPVRESEGGGAVRDEASPGGGPFADGEGVRVAMLNAVPGNAGAGPVAAALENVRPRMVPNPELAGAEIFISSLDAIMEVSHRDRNRRGWFHPSVASRGALLRELAQNPQAEARFNRAMRRTRLFILAMAALGVGVFLAAAKVESAKGPAGGAEGQAAGQVVE